jgi:hypothetical protein
MAVTPRPVNTAVTTLNPLVFIKEVARYFMDFLETDFHKQKTPKRAVRFRNPDNLLVGVSADKYPTFGASLWKLVNRSFAKGVLDHIDKGAFRTPIPENLLELVRLQVSKLSAEQVARVVAAVAQELENAAILYSREYDRALSVTLDAADSAIKAEIVIPLIKNIENPLQNLDLGDDNAIYLMEEELTATLMELLTNKVSELLRLAIGKEKPDIAGELTKVFDVASCR